MYYAGLPAGSERRAGARVNVQVFLNEYVRERPHRALALDLSETGLAIQKLTEPVVERARLVSVELELPGTGEVIWASAESRFDAIGDDFHLSGLRFAAMARKHERLLRDYVRERREVLRRRRVDRPSFARIGSRPPPFLHR
jgi:hypothetical protein